MACAVGRSRGFAKMTWQQALRSGTLGCAVHKMEERVLHDFPTQGPRTAHWLLLEIARDELGPVARDTSGGNKQWGFHHRILELTSTSSCARCLVTARWLTNSIFQTWPWAKRCHDGFSCGKNAMLRSYARPRLVVSLHDMPRLVAPGCLTTLRRGGHPFGTGEAGTIGSPSSEATWRPSFILHTAPSSRPAAPSPDLLPLPTSIGLLPGFKHVKEKVWLRSAVDAINELGRQRVTTPRNFHFSTKICAGQCHLGVRFAA